METIGSRIAAFREARQLKQADVFRDAGIKQQTLSSIESGTEPRGGIIAALLAAYPDLNPDWLLTGSGSMLRDSSASTLIDRPATTAAPVTQAPMLRRAGLSEEDIADLLIKAATLEAELNAEREKTKMLSQHNAFLQAYMYPGYGKPDNQEPAETEQPSAPAPTRGKDDTDSYTAAGINPVSGMRYYNMPARDTSGNVIPASAKIAKMRTDNVSLMQSGELRLLVNAAPIDSFSAISGESEEKAA